MTPQRLPLRLFNATHHLQECLGRRPRSFVESDEVFHEQARQATGSGDFGDPAYREGLGVLLDAYDREARHTPFGRILAEQQITAILKNRLSAQAAWIRDPSLRQHEIRRPIFIIGLPRTGTTALHHLIGQHPGIQVLEYWLAAAPKPRPPRSQWAGAPHFRQARRELRTMYYLDPSLKAVHWMTPDGPEECRHLLMQNFTDDSFDCNATIPAYSTWYEGCDMRPAYRRHRDLLRTIGSSSPERRWLLKYPVHMRNLRTLFEIYPDACIVHTHRDPTKVVPSICSLVADWRAIVEFEPDRKAIAEWQIELWARGMEHAMEVRREQDPARFIDLEFREILADPVAAVRRIYDRFDLDWTPAAASNLRRHRAENPRGRHGEHHYSISDFGLTNARIRDRYAEYIEHFRVPQE